MLAHTTWFTYREDNATCGRTQLRKKKKRPRGWYRGLGHIDNVELRRLVFAASLENRHDAQVRIGEQPLSGFGAGRACCPRQGAEMLVLRETAQVIEANPGQIG